MNVIRVKVTVFFCELFSGALDNEDLFSFEVEKHSYNFCCEIMKLTPGGPRYYVVTMFTFFVREWKIPCAYVKLFNHLAGVIT